MGLDVSSRPGEAGLQGQHIAGLDPQGPDIRRAAYGLVQHHADVAPVVRGGFAQLVLADVDGGRAPADGTGVAPAVPGVEADVHFHAIEGMEPAHGTDLEGAVGIQFANHKADVVQMGRDGNRILLPAKGDDDAALAADLAPGIAQPLQLPEQIVLDLPELPRSAVDVQQSL